MLRSMPNRSPSLMPSLNLRPNLIPTPSPSPMLDSSPVPSPRARRRLPTSRLPKTGRPTSASRKRTGSITPCHRSVPIGAMERAVLRPVPRRRLVSTRCRGRPSTFRNLISEQPRRILPSRRRRLSSRPQERNSRCLNRPRRNRLCSHSPFRNRMQSRSRPS